MNYVTLTFHWIGGHKQSYIVAADSDPTPESLSATVAGIHSLFGNGDYLLLTDWNGRAFSICREQISSIEAEKLAGRRSDGIN